jgi:stage III sporulation protein AD
LTREIFTLLSTALFGVVCLVVLRQIKKEYAPFATAAFSVVLFGVGIKRAAPVIEYFATLDVGALDPLVQTLFGVFSVALVTHLVSQICSDLGEESVSGKVEFVGKMTLLSLILPLIKGVVEIARGLL